MSRLVEVSADRWDGWLARFETNQANSSVPQRIVSIDRFDHDPLAVLLIRRGGYAVAVASHGSLLAHKVGTRHVQSRTAAGGWSQQRFARRRGNQADALVGAVTEHLLRIRAASGVRPAGVVAGGDRALVAQVLDDPRLRELRALPRREVYDIADPRRNVLEDVVRRGSAVRVAIIDPE